MKENIPPLSLYIHIPWCIKKCPYCDFNSHAVKNNFEEETYINCLIEDLIQDLQYVQNREIISIFIGGGTPSLFSSLSYEKLFTELSKLIKFAENIEITMEANPGTLEYKNFADYKAVGINRVSIGAQSFNDLYLQKLGRIHNKDNIFSAIENLKKANIDNFNIDIMYGLPEQTAAEALLDLQTAIQLNPEHISWYNLTIEPNTYFHKFKPVLPNDEVIYEIQLHGKELLIKNGFHKYEVSAYAKNKKCLHNLNYWQFGDYLGIGAGAHGKITINSDNKEFSVIRTQKTRLPKDYLDKNKKYTCLTKVITSQDKIFEFMLNALRLEQGFSFELFENHTGLKIDNISHIINTAIDKQLIKVSNNLIQPTDLGRNFLNDLCEMFL